MSSSSSDADQERIVLGRTADEYVEPRRCHELGARLAGACRRKSTAVTARHTETFERRNVRGDVIGPRRFNAQLHVYSETVAVRGLTLTRQNDRRASARR